MAYAPHLARLATPIGMVEITGDADAVATLTIDPGQQDEIIPPQDGPVAQAARQIREYFAGTRRQFDLPLAPAATPRGSVLRAAIAAVPYAETMTYGTLAALNDSSSRAVGQACARNPLPIIIPCHRVVSAGRTEHYSGGDGTVTKAWLLAHERSTLLNRKE